MRGSAGRRCGWRAIGDRCQVAAPGSMATVIARGRYDEWEGAWTYPYRVQDANRELRDCARSASAHAICRDADLVVAAVGSSQGNLAVPLILRKYEVEIAPFFLHVHLQDPAQQRIFTVGRHPAKEPLLSVMYQLNSDGAAVESGESIRRHGRDPIHILHWPKPRRGLVCQQSLRNK
jgi:hypothetical protein